MPQILTIVFYILLAGLLVVLGLGIANMVRTDENQPSRSNKLMRMRVLLQFVAVVLIVATLWLTGGGR